MPMPTPFSSILGGRPMPRLWCPPLTHFTADGSLDTTRMEAHWRAMRPDVSGFLVPGSTGEGWELDQAETARLLEFCLGLARDLDALVLVGMLRPDAADARAAMAAFIQDAQRRAGTDDITRALAALGVCGFTVCATTGEHLSADAMRRGLEGILSLGAPTALYQLPQVTQNEIPPGMLADLAARFANLVLFKDSSGGDRVASDKGAASSGVYLVRGAEGDYAARLAESGGPYHGLLLGSANSCHAQLAAMLAALETGDAALAGELSDQVTRVIGQAFAAVDGLTDANAFTNANKALDHWLAWGSCAISRPMPMLHCGRRLPESVVRRAGDILSQAGLMPEKGYLPA